MADKSKRNAQVELLRRHANLIARASGKAVRPYRADGFVNLMTKYGTSKDTSEQYQFVPGPQFPDSLLTMFYEENGLFAKIIDAPAEEAVKHGFTLDDVADQKLTDFYQEALEELDFEETAMTAIKWARLYGGSIAIMLINDGRGLEEPLDWRHIQSIDDIRVYDRSIIQPDYESMYSYTPDDPFRTRGSRLGMPERYQVFSKYGTFTVHDSRCLVFRNGVLPESASNSVYQFWGQPEYVRINKAIRDAEIAHGSAPKLLDRSVQAIYKMKDLSTELATEEGEDRLLRRLQIIDMARGMMNSIAIDSEGEEYDFRTFQFSGVNDVISASCNMLSAVTNIPQVILFGQKVGGMGTGDDTSMENWYSYVERIDKRMVKSNLRYLLSIVFQAGLATGEVDEVPKINVVFNPLWSLSDAEQADLELKREQVKLAKAQTTQVYVGMQAIDASEVRKKLADSDEYDVEQILDEYEEEDLFPPEEQPSPDGSMLPPGTSIPEQRSSAQYGEGVDQEAHNADPQVGGNGPAAAPAATKLPQDMSQEELEQKAKEGQADGARKDAVENAQLVVRDGSDNASPDTTSSVGVIVVKGGKILCGVRDHTEHSGMICGPGGHVKEGETYEQAAFRETEEEFGISPKELIPLGYGPREEDTGEAPALFLCTDYNGEPYSRDGEMKSPVFLSMEELTAIVGTNRLFPPFFNSLKVLMDRLDKDIAEDGGPGSGNFGHAGRAGEVGGSSKGDRSPVSHEVVTPAKAVDKIKEYAKKAASDGLSSFRDIKTSLFVGTKNGNLPQLVPPEKFEEAESDQPVVYRGFEEAEQMEQFLNGEAYVGSGFAGSGTNVAINRSESESYGGDNVIEMKLAKGAKVISDNDLMPLFVEVRNSLSDKGGSDEEKFASWIGSDPGCVAAALGYDAIYSDLLGWFNVINRSQLIVRKQGSTKTETAEDSQEAFLEKPIDKSAQSVTIKSQGISADGAPKGNQNAAGPHQRSHLSEKDKAKYKKRLIGQRTSDGVEIKALSDHACDRIAQRNISAKKIEEMLASSTVSPDKQHPGSRRCYDTKGRRLVVDFTDGTIVTVEKRRQNK